MKRILVGLTALMLVTAPSAARDRELRPLANPSAVVAAELAFARMARDKGQWTAFRETAAKDAEMFVPLRVRAQTWLKGRADPPVAVTWQPHEVWSSCDGSYAVTRGAWQRPGEVGYFTTVWQRQKNGGYKWVLDQGDSLREAAPVPEMISAEIADCAPVTSGSAAASARIVDGTLDEKTGRSRDNTLEWTMTVQPDGARNFSVQMWQGGEMKDVIISEVAAPQPR